MPTGDSLALSSHFETRDPTTLNTGNAGSFKRREETGRWRLCEGVGGQVGFLGLFSLE